MATWAGQRAANPKGEHLEVGTEEFSLVRFFVDTKK